MTITTATYDVDILQGMSDARVTLTGTMSLLEDSDIADAKVVFLKKNPGKTVGVATAVGKVLPRHLAVDIKR